MNNLTNPTNANATANPVPITVNTNANATSAVTSATVSSVASDAAQTPAPVKEEAKVEAKPTFGHYYLASSFAYLAPNETTVESEENDEVSLIKKKWEKGVSAAR